MISRRSEMLCVTPGEINSLEENTYNVKRESVLEPVLTVKLSGVPLIT